MTDEEKLNRYRAEEAEENEKNDTTEAVQEVKEEKATDDNKSLEEIDKLKKELQDMTTNYLRALADLENFKKRTYEERTRERKYQNQSLLEQLIVDFDILDKAINVQTDDSKVKNFLLGFQMINNNFKQILTKEGVTKIKCLGEKFDPTCHYAVETTWDPTKEEGIIIEELQTGYMYKDRVLRNSLVKVNKKVENKENKKDK